MRRAVVVAAVLLAGCSSNSSGPPDTLVAAADAGSDAGVAGPDGGADAPGILLRDGPAAALDTGSDGPVSGDGSAPDAMGAGDIASRAIFTRVAIRARHLVADRSRKRIYASVAGDALEYANSIVTLDARDGSVLASLPVGSNPDLLALSDDGSVLWLSVDGLLGIRRLDLTTSPPTPGPVHTLPPDKNSSGAPTRAGAMVVLPGEPKTLGIVLYNQRYFSTAILDDGVARPIAAMPLSPIPKSLTVGPPGYLFGFNSGDTGFDFITLAVTPAGVTQTAFPGLVSGFETTIAYQSGRVFASSGEIVDVSMPARPTSGGKIAYTGPLAAAGPNRILMLQAGSSVFQKPGPTQVVVLDTTTARPFATVAFDPATLEWSNAGARDIGFLGGDAMAFIGVNKKQNSEALTPSVIIIHHPALTAAD